LYRNVLYRTIYVIVFIFYEYNKSQNKCEYLIEPYNGYHKATICPLFRYKRSLLGSMASQRSLQSCRCFWYDQVHTSYHAYISRYCFLPRCCSYSTMG